VKQNWTKTRLHMKGKRKMPSKHPKRDQDCIGNFILIKIEFDFHTVNANKIYCHTTQSSI